MTGENMIEWQESYSVGVVQLDEQHKNLFQYSNDLEEGLKRRAVSKQTLEGALKFLGNYVKYHFSDEESCMHQYVCPIAGKNKLAHQHFIEQYHMFQGLITESGDNEGILKDIHRFLEDWLLEHICKIDTQLKSCILKSP